jgi:hypothetical protein
MTVILLKACYSILLVALGRILTMDPKLPEGYEDSLGFHYGSLPKRRF